MILSSDENLKALVLFAVVGLLALAPALLMGQALASSDLVQGLYPFLSFIKHSLSQGQAPIWTPNVFFGFPQFVLGNFFYPFFLLLKFVSVFSLYAWLVWLNVVAAGYFAFYFLRKERLELWPSLLSGLVWMFACWQWVTDLSLAVALPAMPLLFILFQRRQSLRSVIGGSILVGYLLYAANFNLLPIIFASVGSFVVFEGRRQESLSKHFFSYCAMLGGGIVLALPQLIPTFIFSALSAREGGLNFSFASLGSLLPGDLIRIVLPYAQVPFIGTGAYFYIGSLPVVALLAAIFFPAKEEHRKVRIFFLYLLAFGLLTAVKYSPLFWLMSKLPVLSSLRDPSRWLLASAFGASILSGMGLQGLIAMPKEVLWRRVALPMTIFTIIFSFALASISVVDRIFGQKIIARLNQYFTDHYYAQTSGLPLAHYQQVIAQTYQSFVSSFDVRDYHVFLAVFFFLAASLLLYFYVKGKITAERFASYVLFITAINFIVLLLPFHPTVARAVIEGESKLVVHMRQNPGPYFTLLPGFTEYETLSVPHHPDALEIVEYQKNLLPPNVGELYGLAGADYYNNLMSRRAARLLAVLGSDRATIGEKLSDEHISLDEKLAKFMSRKKLLDLLGIRYVISGYKLPQPLELVMQVSTTKFALPVYLYENVTARPVAYLADATQVIEPSEEGAYQTIMSKIPIARDSIIECSSDCPQTTGNATGHMDIVERSASHWLIRINTKDDRWLVVAQNDLPGWTATIDGEPAQIRTAQSVFLGVLVPSGTHEISLQYSYLELLKNTNNED